MGVEQLGADIAGEEGTKRGGNGSFFGLRAGF